MTYDWMSKASAAGGRRFVNFAELKDGNTLLLEGEPQAPQRSQFAVFEAEAMLLTAKEALDGAAVLLAPGASVAGLIKMSLPAGRDLLPGDRLVARVTWNGSKRNLAFEHVPAPAKVS